VNQWSIRLDCAGCGNRTRVNLEHFDYRRIELLRSAVQVMACGVCGERRVTGMISAGSDPDAQMVLDGHKQFTWTRDAVAEAAARAKRDGHG